MLSPLLAALLLPGLSGSPKPAVNTLCPVMGNKVTAKSPEAVVNGRAYKLCCKGCDAKLKAAPSKYLAPDGTPLNAAKAK